MNEERINKLQRYLETLVTLKGADFYCNDEIQQTICELGKELGIERSKRVMVEADDDKFKPTRGKTITAGTIKDPYSESRLVDYFKNNPKELAKVVAVTRNTSVARAEGVLNAIWTM